MTPADLFSPKIIITASLAVTYVLDLVNHVWPKAHDAVKWVVAFVVGQAMVWGLHVSIEPGNAVATVVTGLCLSAIAAGVAQPAVEVVRATRDIRQAERDIRQAQARSAELAP